MTTELTEDTFDGLFSPQQNHIVDNASFDGAMYETYGKELEYVLEFANDFNKQKRVWTILEVDGKMYLTAGYHLVNRIGYIITDKSWVSGEEEFGFDTDIINYYIDGKPEEALSYIFYKENFSDSEFYDLISIQLSLPQFCDLFDRNDETEIAEKYRPYFSDGSSVEVLHENLRITDEGALQMFLLDYANTTNEMDEAIKEAINKKCYFQLGGDGDGLGFIVDIWESFDDVENGEEPIDMRTFWFEDWSED